MTKARSGGRGSPAASDSMLPRILTIVAGVAFVAALACITLKVSLVKPGRIIAAANSTQIHETLPGVILQVVMEGPLKQLKRLNLSAKDLEPTARAAFPPEWVATELEIIVHDVAAAMKSGEPVKMDLGLEPIKDDLGQAIGALLRERVDRVPVCASAAVTLCKPNGSEARFLGGLNRAVTALVQEIPDEYPLLAGPAAEGIKSLQGILGSLGMIAILLLLLSIGAGVFARIKNEDETPLLHSAGLGLVGGSLVILFVVNNIKGAVLGGLGAVTGGYEPAVAKNLQEFISQGFGAGFTVAFVVLAVTLVAGGGAIFKARQDA